MVPTQRITNIPPQTKLLAVLHLLASGTFQPTIAIVGGVSQPALSKFITPVLDAILSFIPQYLHFPNTAQEQQETRQGFYDIAGFPAVLGAIDCTHVPLVPPADTAHHYRNRKYTHSINVQAIVDHWRLFTNVVANYPGSVHDSFIFRQSIINQCFQDGTYGMGLRVGKCQINTPYTSKPSSHNAQLWECTRKQTTYNMPINMPNYQT